MQLYYALERELIEHLTSCMENMLVNILHDVYNENMHDRC